MRLELRATTRFNIQGIMRTTTDKPSAMPSSSPTATQHGAPARSYQAFDPGGTPLCSSDGTRCTRSARHAHTRKKFKKRQKNVKKFQKGWSCPRKASGWYTARAPSGCDAEFVPLDANEHTQKVTQVTQKKLIRMNIKVDEETHWVLRVWCAQERHTLQDG